MTPTLRKNLEALASRDKLLARAIETAAPDPATAIQTARSGLPVPGLTGATGTVLLHSRYDPQREAARAAAGLTDAGFLVFLGLGGGYHVRAALTPGLTGALVVERQMGHVRSVMEHCDLSDILSDPRLTLVVDAAPASVTRFLLDNYLPLIAGKLRTVPLANRIGALRDRFSEAADAVRAALESLAGDLSVQARFGRLWFRNTLANLPAADASAQDTASGLPRIDQAVVTAGGPSLTTLLPRALRSPLPLIATDTSLPTLRRMGVAPDFVVSIDCQTASYHHFAAGMERSTSFVLDLATPPFLGRRKGRHFYVASPHPLAQYLRRTWRPLPPLDTTGGNVTHSAAALAARMGAERIFVIGADFAYPDGMPYARDSYFHDHFRRRETRTAPLEGALLGYVLGRPGSHVPPEDGRRIYHTPRMDTYRERFFSGFPGYEITESRRGWIELTRRRAEDHRAPEEASRLVGPWSRALSDAGLLLRALPPSTEPLGSYWRDLSQEQRQTWTLVLSLSAGREDMPSAEGLEHARSLGSTLIRRFLPSTTSFFV